jgi:hypothetical protein
VGFVLTITVWALLLQAQAGFAGFGGGGGLLPLLNGCVASTLLVLAALVVAEAVRAVARTRTAALSAVSTERG